MLKTVQEEIKSHKLILNDRQTLTLTGVVGIESCDETQAVIQTVFGELVITGSKLHINQTNLDTGDAGLSGEIRGIKYNKEKTKVGKFINKLLK